MKKIFLSLTINFLLLQAFGQVTYYKGEWTKINKEDNFAALLKLEIKDTALAGEIIWTFVAIDSGDAESLKYYKGQKGKTGIEYVKGSFFSKSSDIQFEGIEKKDPHLIIGLDKYLLKLSASKSVIYGRTLSNGENNGLVYFYKVDKLTGEKEFNSLKTKLLSISGERAMR